MKGRKKKVDTFDCIKSENLSFTESKFRTLTLREDNMQHLQVTKAAGLIMKNSDSQCVKTRHPSENGSGTGPDPLHPGELKCHVPKLHILPSDGKICRQYTRCHFTLPG